MGLAISGVHERAEPWPFLYSVLPDGPRGIVRNVQPEPKTPPPRTLVRDPATGRLRRPPGHEVRVIKVKAAKKVPAAKGKRKPKPFDGAASALVDIAATWSGAARTQPNSTKAKDGAK
jgi:hypothetical protein